MEEIAPDQGGHAPIRFPVTPCPYFPGQPMPSAPSVFSRKAPLDPDDCDRLLDSGWRHFGQQYFRNDCPGCSLCLPLRIPVMHLSLSHSQRRLVRKSAHIQSRFFAPRDFIEQYFFEALEIHNAFSRTRYGQGPLAPETFHASFVSSPAPLLVHGLFLPDNRLIGCGWLDAGRRNLSSIYFSWDPACAASSPGTLSMLREALFARESGREYYHLGYWIRGHSSMGYKAALRPGEILDFASNRWSPLQADGSAPCFVMDA